MNLVITGASGFIGSNLVESVWKESHTLKLLSRKPLIGANAPRKEWMYWEPGVPGEWGRSINGADGIIHLAGEPIAAKRWSAAQKEKISASRIETTKALVDAIGKAKSKPKFLISSSAVGYYGPHGDETLTEESAPGSDYLARVCVDWEAEAKKAEAQGVRVVLLRTGIVLAKGQGALAKMVPPFKFFFGGPLGSGKQWMPWIHIEDVVGLIIFLMEQEEDRGAFNVTAPNPVTMEDFCKAIGAAVNRPSWANVPASMLSLLVGEMADMLLSGQRAMPQAALRSGYEFKFRNVREAIESLEL